MDNELITYIIPIWKRSKAEELSKSLLSLVNESSLIGEIIIVFDGYESFFRKLIVPNILSEKIIYVYCGINKGPGIARNKGAIFAKNKYLFFLDSGDESCSYRVSEQIKHLKFNDVAFGNIVEILPSGKRRIKKGASSKTMAKRILPYRNPFNNVTIAINKKTFLRIGGYQNLRVGEDWVLMGKILKYNLRIFCLDEVLVNVFTGKDFIDRRSGKYFYEDIKKCLTILNDLNLINKINYFISLSFQYLFRNLIPKKLLGLIYKFLRN